MDCLDRTNVMQSVFARWALARQLAALHHAANGEKDHVSNVLQADRSVEFSLPNEVRRLCFCLSFSAVVHSNSRM
jgi:hypothetical protein